MYAWSCCRNVRNACCRALFWLGYLCSINHATQSCFFVVYLINNSAASLPHALAENSERSYYNCTLRMRYLQSAKTFAKCRSQNGLSKVLENAVSFNCAMLGSIDASVDHVSPGLYQLRNGSIWKYIAGEIWWRHSRSLCIPGLHPTRYLDGLLQQRHCMAFRSVLHSVLCYDRFGGMCYKLFSQVSCI